MNLPLSLRSLTSQCCVWLLASVRDFGMKCQNTTKQEPVCKLAAEIDGHSFACISVPPGNHTITGWMSAHPSDATDSVVFTASTNETRYLEATVTSAWKSTLRLRLVAPESEREAIRKMKNVGVPLPGSL
jgi:hypothetical protein